MTAVTPEQAVEQALELPQLLGLAGAEPVALDLEGSGEQLQAAGVGGRIEGPRDERADLLALRLRRRVRRLSRSSAGAGRAPG